MPASRCSSRSSWSRSSCAAPRNARQVRCSSSLSQRVVSLITASLARLLNAQPTGTVERVMPAIYLSHGAPPLADDARWTRELADWSADLPRPTAILVVSAHWEEAPLTVG